MNRVGIFTCFNEDGIVDDYKIYLLESMKEYLTDLIIIINGDIRDTDLKILKTYSEHVYIRKDFGFDAGAYKDLFTEKYEDVTWESADEIILFNDSFFGPLYSWQEVFEKMEQKKKDFWGLSMFEATDKYPAFIHTYFLAINKKMFCSKAWTVFWEELACYNALYEGNFETSFTQYFHENGFQYSTWLTENKVFLSIDNYYEQGYDLVSKYGLPVIKWRNFSVLYYKQAELLMDYVEKNTNYEKKMIIDRLERVDYRMLPFSLKRMEKFMNKYKEGYIFGSGKYGKIIEKICHGKGWKCKGFIVSEPKSNNEISVEDIILKKEEGIIVALGITNWREVRNILRSRFPQDQLLAPLIE